MDIEKIQALETEIADKTAQLNALKKELDIERGGYLGPIPRPACNRDTDPQPSWHACWGCCDSSSQMRIKQGSFC